MDKSLDGLIWAPTNMGGMQQMAFFVPRKEVTVGSHGLTEEHVKTGGHNLSLI